jgi:ferredoxin
MTDVKVVFVINGMELETTMSESESILEAALRIQINPPYSCLEGICGSCSALIEQGEILGETSGETSGEVDSVEGRVIKTCRAQPKSKFLQVNYDKAKLE